MKFKKYFAVVVMLFLITLTACTVDAYEEDENASLKIECQITACDTRVYPRRNQRYKGCPHPHSRPLRRSVWSKSRSA